MQEKISTTQTESPTEPQTLPTTEPEPTTESSTKPTTEPTTEPSTEPTTEPPTEPPATDDPLDTFDFVEELRNLEYCTIYNITVKSEGFNDTFGASQTLFTIGKTGQPPEIDGPEEVSIYEVDTTSVVVS